MTPTYRHIVASIATGGTTILMGWLLGFKPVVLIIGAFLGGYIAAEINLIISAFGSLRRSK